MYPFNNVKLFSLRHISNGLHTYNRTGINMRMHFWFDPLIFVRVIHVLSDLKYERISTEHYNDEGIKCVQCTVYRPFNTKNRETQNANKWCCIWLTPLNNIIRFRLFCIFIKLPLFFLIKLTMTIYCFIR